MAKVSIIKCSSYERDEVFEAVKNAISLVGGLEKLVKPGMNVLLKPNLLSARPPEDGVDTHPEVVRAVARLVKERGAKPIIGDSPGGFGKNANEVFKVSGMKEMADEEGIEIVKFTSSKFVDGIPISRHVFSSNCYISIPKLKTHCITVLTAAIKNTFGTVAGVYKAECHSKAPQEEAFAKIIAKVYSVSKPHLTILDGVLAMEGDGPSGGAPRKMNLIMAGHDAVAMDSCVAKIVGLEPEDVCVTLEARKMGLGETDLSKIEVVGDGIENFLTSDFKLPQTTPLKALPRIVAHGIGKLIRFKPFIDKSICRRCNLCRSSCAVNAILIKKSDYIIDYAKCVRCLCCYELCPYKAIKIKRNILTRIVWG